VIWPTRENETRLALKVRANFAFVANPTGRVAPRPRANRRLVLLTSASSGRQESISNEPAHLRPLGQILHHRRWEILFGHYLFRPSYHLAESRVNHRINIRMVIMPPLRLIDFHLTNPICSPADAPCPLHSPQCLHRTPRPSKLQSSMRLWRGKSGIFIISPGALRKSASIIRTR